jgi:Tripartite tricarboxylate transporter TctB family
LSESSMQNPVLGSCTQLIAPETVRRRVFARLGDHLTAVVAIALGVAGWLEASRIRETVRPTSPSFGVVGPDGYLFAIAGALLTGGVLFLAAGMVRGFRASRRRTEADDPTPTLITELIEGDVDELEPVATQARWGAIRVALLGGLLVAYIYGITTIGYAVSTLIFVALAAKVSGFKSWWRVALFAVAVTVVAYILFVYEAELPLPSGPFTF